MYKKNINFFLIIILQYLKNYIKFKYLQLKLIYKYVKSYLKITNN